MLKAIILALLFSITARAEIIEVTKYEEALKYVNNETLFVTDLDNTVVKPAQTIGSDQWGAAEGKRFAAAGIPEAEAEDLGVGMFTFVQLKTKVLPVESTTPGILKALAKRGIKTLGLTARPLVLMDRTLEQLKSVQVSLTGTTAKPNIDFGKGSVGYQGGVLFVGAHGSKGQILKQYLESNPLKNIKRIVFIDDRSKHTKTMDEAFAGSAYEVKALRYGAIDPIVKALDMNKAKQEWEDFLTTGKL